MTVRVKNNFLYIFVDCKFYQYAHKHLYYDMFSLSLSPPLSPFSLLPPLPLSLSLSLSPSLQTCGPLFTSSP